MLVTGADDKGGPTVHGRNQLLKQSCWKKNIKRMQPSEIQMEPESTSRSNSKVTLALFNAQCHFLKARSTGCQLEGSKREYEGQSPLWLGRAEKDPAQFLRRKVWSSCSRNVLSSIQQQTLQSLGGTKVCTATPWEHRFATALPFRHVQMLCRG